jgi:cell division protease FtsH
LTLGAEEAVVQTRSQLTQQLFVLLGGWAAEQLEFGEPSTGSEDDLEHATNLARDMIGRFGMSKTLGPTRLLMPSAESYLHDGHASSSLAPETLAAFDGAVRDLIKQTCDGTVAAMRKRRKDLVDLADRVIKAESLEGPELAKLLAKIGRRAPARGATDRRVR